MYLHVFFILDAFHLHGEASVPVHFTTRRVAFATRDEQILNPVFWAVGDLVKLPFQDEQYQVILNILSPANYKELTSHLKESELEVFKQKQINEITIDLMVLIGNFHKGI